ncbi:MAG: hypothetical protein ACM3VW_07590 [Bacteroidota bacterium]
MRHSLAVVALLVLIVTFLSGCGGGSGLPSIDLGNNTIIEPPVGTAAVSPDAAKFGPIAAYLPPSGTIVNYRMSRFLTRDSNQMRVQFKNYDNTAGTAVVRITYYDGPDVIGDIGYTLWFKALSGKSYVYKRKKIFYDEVRPAELTTFTPGVMMGLFTGTPLATNVEFTSAGHSAGSHTYTSRYLGNANVTAGGQTFSAKVLEVRNFMAGDPAAMQIYWAAGKGPVMFSLAPVGILKGLAMNSPWWRRIAGGTATSITTE